MKTQMDYKKYPDVNLSPNRAPSVLSTVRKGATIIRCTCLSEYDKSYGKCPFCGRTPKTEGRKPIPSTVKRYLCCGERSVFPGDDVVFRIYEDEEEFACRKNGVTVQKRNCTEWLRLIVQNKDLILYCRQDKNKSWKYIEAEAVKIHLIHVLCGITASEEMEFDGDKNSLVSAISKCCKSKDMFEIAKEYNPKDWFALLFAKHFAEDALDIALLYPQITHRLLREIVWNGVAQKVLPGEKSAIELSGLYSKDLIEYCHENEIGWKAMKTMSRCASSFQDDKKDNEGIDWNSVVMFIARKSDFAGLRIIKSLKCSTQELMKYQEKQGELTERFKSAEEFTEALVKWSSLLQGAGLSLFLPDNLDKEITILNGAYYLDAYMSECENTQKGTRIKDLYTKFHDHISIVKITLNEVENLKRAGIPAEFQISCTDSGEFVACAKIAGNIKKMEFKNIREKERNR